MLSRVSRRVMATRHPNQREKYVVLGDQDLAGFRSDLLPALRRRESSLSLRPPQMPAVGDLAGSLMGTLNRERGRTWRARSRLRRGTRGAPVRERGPAWPVVAVSRDRIPRKKDC